MKKYDHAKIEKKWQKIWERSGIYKAKDNSDQKKFYGLIEFPFPSGEGMHTGHLRSNTAMDIISRKRRMEGFNVLYPIGWDAFGLPTENYALKTGVSPQVATKKNTDTFRRQLKSAGFSFDWSREINTTDPTYYRWTQWIFLQMYKHGLAYKKKMMVNWCPKDRIVLANEEVIDGKCERCGTAVEKREKEQWILAITKYADRLDRDLDTVDYLERVKIQQRNWIGRSEGAEIDFLLNFKKNPDDNKRRGPDGKPAALKIFTTRPDTLFGVTYLVLAPEHPWVVLATDNDHNVLINKEDVKEYIKKVRGHTDIERTAEGKEKEGIELKGVKAVNPATQEEIPIWIADYVLPDYGTGAVMAVPAHDERDWAFARKYNLPLKKVIDVTKHHWEVGEMKMKLADQIPNTSPGVLIDSGHFTGIKSEEAKKLITESVGGKWLTTYRLRDWIFSRQRYWGEPIPMIHCEKCGWVPVPEKDLPVKLPVVKKYQPTDTGESPLATMTKWVNVKCPQCKSPARRETDTMPNWAGSSWYFLRYIDHKNKKSLADPKKLAYWTPVDWYNGGMEHTTLHLLYSRFWNKFLFDIGVVPTSEPYTKRTSHGLILAPDGEKMSKSRGNVVNPDQIIKDFGADTLRLYEMFMGPFDQTVAWSTDGIVGPRRFLERVWRLHEKVVPKKPFEAALESSIHSTMKKVSEDIEKMSFNTAISALMILTNEMDKRETIPVAYYKHLLALLAPFAPHICEELWSILGNKTSINLEKWPTFDASKIVLQNQKIAIQINGKVRGETGLDPSDTEAVLTEKALALPEIKKWIDGKNVKKTIYVKGKLINIVVDSV